MNKVLLVSWLILIVAACTPAELQTPITDTATSTSIPTATITVTPLVALPQPTESLETTTTTSPEVFVPRTGMIYHVVQAGETTRDIAERYHLSEESVVFSNFEVLPQDLAPGMTLVIPPVDGFYYIIKDGDALPDVSHRYGVSLISILSWPENGLDQEVEDIEPGKIIFIPGGKNPNFDWSTPTPLAETAP